MNQITKIVQEIRDINKDATTCCRGNPNKADTYGKGAEHCNNSSYNTPQCRSMPDNLERHAPCRPDTPLPQNGTPAQRCLSSDPSSSSATSAGQNKGPHKDLRAETSGHKKFTGLTRYSLTQLGEGPLEMKPNLKKAEGKASSRGEREDSEGAGEPLDPDPDEGQAQSKVLPRD